MKTQMFGNTIHDQFGSGNNWPLGFGDVGAADGASSCIGVFVYLRRVGEDAL